MRVSAKNVQYKTPTLRRYLRSLHKRMVAHVLAYGNVISERFFQVFTLNAIAGIMLTIGGLLVANNTLVRLGTTDIVLALALQMAVDTAIQNIKHQSYEDLDLAEVNHYESIERLAAISRKRNAGRK